MSRWHMLTIFGEDRAGIVARVTQALYQGGCNLGEVSAIRLGGYFTIMMIVAASGPGQEPSAGAEDPITAMLHPVAEEMQLTVHVSPIRGRLHEDIAPDVRVSVFGADRPGIVAQATAALASAGLNIIHLESDVGGSPEKPIYIMQIEGQATRGIDRLREALVEVRRGGVEATISPVETMVT